MLQGHSKCTRQACSLGCMFKYSRCMQAGLLQSNPTRLCTALNGAALLNLFCAVNSASKTVSYNMTLEWKTLAPDGFRRPTIVINGQTPGPTLRCSVGDRLIVHVENKIDQPVSIHW